MPDMSRRALFLIAGVLTACGGRPAAVSPEEIPELATRVAEDPDNGRLLLRYSAALFAAGRCDTATAVAQRGMELASASAIGPLVVGQCLERSGNLDDALAVYRAFLAEHPDSRGAGAVGAREARAARTLYTARARQALQRETELSAQTPDPSTVAVLPLEISGDSTYSPLSRGLAQMLISDLALLQRFRMVERLQLGTLLEELELQQGARVDPSTAARVGRLVQAGRLVQGLIVIPPDERNVRLEATVVRPTGEVASPEGTEGRLRDLLRMEKDLVIAIASQLGYTLSEAERREILENGTQNLAAFLAYSRGLELEDQGNYQAAAGFYAEAARRDPGFREARAKFGAAAASETVEQASPGEVTAVAEFEPPADELIDAVAGAVDATVVDLVPTLVEQNTVQQTGQGGSTTSGGGDDPPPPPQTPVGVIRIVFKLP